MKDEEVRLLCYRFFQLCFPVPANLPKASTVTNGSSRRCKVRDRNTALAMYFPATLYPGQF